MKISFWGAARQVTGSMHLLEACGKKFLIDCGMEQGPKIYEEQDIPFDASQIDGVFLTHAHIDHSGRLPLLYKVGFGSKLKAKDSELLIHTTSATMRLCDIMLRDSAHIQEQETEWKNRKAERSGAPIVEPMYTMEDAKAVLTMFHGHPYGEEFEVCSGITACFFDAGHLLGSSIIVFKVTEDGVTEKIVFSGDVGNYNMPLLNNPTAVSEADVVVIESTYGDRLHTQVSDPVAAMADVLSRTFARGGVVVIPAFAVGRTQELLYYIREIKERALVTPQDFEVVLDSPLAIEATTIFQNIGESYYDDKARKLIDEEHTNPIGFDNLRVSLTSQDSMLLNEINYPCVIISASGMCEAGRIKHHLKHRLWDKRNTVLFSGYQCEGTVGALLLDGAKEVKLFGESVKVGAEVTKLDNTSAHADRNGLMRWLKDFKTPPKRVFVVHGEEQAALALASEITTELGISATVPYFGEQYDLVSLERTRKPVVRKAAPVQPKKPTARKVSTHYARLVRSMDTLRKRVEAGSEISNGELKNFADDIDRINEKYKWISDKK